MVAFGKFVQHSSLQVEQANLKYQTTWTNIFAILASALGSFVYGYCLNSTAGSFVQPSFVAKFLSDGNAESIIGGIIGGFLGGGLIGTIISAPVSNRFGRRIATGSGAVITTVAAALQAGSVHIAMFMTARVIGGIGAGILITNCPVYMSEISPPHIRGRLVSSHAIGVVWAYITSSLAALGFNYLETDYQWRLQFVLLTFFGLLLLASLIFLPESPRWLAYAGRDSEALEVLQYLHQTDENATNGVAAREMAQIRAQIEEERSLATDYITIFRVPELRRRAICSLLTWIMGQSTGVLVIANLTPTLFGQLGYGPVLQLGLAVVWTVCAMLGCFVNAAVMDKVGRVKLLVGGGYLCSIVLILEAILQKYYIGSANTAGINAAVALYFIWALAYGSTVDCAAYVYVSEIWPTYLRSQGNTIGMLAFYSLALVYTTPAAVAFQQIGWKYYWVMICVCITSATAMIFTCPETANLTLEEISAKFGHPVALELQQNGLESGTPLDGKSQEDDKPHVETIARV